MIDEKLAKITLLEDKLDEEGKFNDYLINQKRTVIDDLELKNKDLEAELREKNQQIERNAKLT